MFSSRVQAHIVMYDTECIVYFSSDKILSDFAQFDLNVALFSVSSAMEEEEEQLLIGDVMFANI